MTCLSPFLAIYANLFFVLWSTDNNLIKSKVALKSKKLNAVTKSFKVAELKRISQYYNCTLNDIVLSIVSKSLKQYLLSKGDEKTQSMNLLVPFSLRALPQSIKEHRLENDFSILCFTLTLFEKIEDAIKQVSG